MALRLKASDLAVERGGERLTSGISFIVESGCSLVVTGENGTGKSSLLRVIAGLLPAAEGKVTLEGGGETWPDVQSASHYLGPENAMKPALTVTENLDFWRSFLGGGGLSAAEALDAVELPGVAALPFGYLSTGQRRRVAFARLLVGHRPVWLLDEPTSGLDMRSQKRFAGFMKRHLGEGGIVVAVTHIPLGIAGAQELVLRGRDG